MIRRLADQQKLFAAGVEDAKLGLIPRLHWLKKTFDLEDQHYYTDGYRSACSTAGKCEAET